MIRLRADTLGGGVSEKFGAGAEKSGRAGGAEKVGAGEGTGTGGDTRGIGSTARGAGECSKKSFLGADGVTAKRSAGVTVIVRWLRELVIP